MHARHRRWGGPKRPLLALAAAVVVPVLVAGCSSDAPPDPEAEPPGPIPRSAFAELLTAGDEAEVRVTYTLVDGASDPPVEEEAVLAQQPPRVSVRTGSGMVIDNGDGSLATCTLGDEAECLRLPGVGDADATLLSEFVATFSSLVSEESPSEVARYTPEPGVVIAQRPAVCASYEAAPMGDSTDAGGDSTTSTLPDHSRIRIVGCVDESSGVLLLLEARNEDGTAVRLEAVAVERPAAADFVAPAPVPSSPTG